MSLARYKPKILHTRTQHFLIDYDVREITNASNCEFHGPILAAPVRQTIYSY